MYFFKTYILQTHKTTMNALFYDCCYKSVYVPRKVHLHQILTALGRTNPDKKLHLCKAGTGKLFKHLCDTDSKLLHSINDTLN